MYFLCELPLCENRWSVVSFSDDWPPTCETFILWRKLCVSLKKGDKKHHFWAKKIPLKLTPERVAIQNGVRITHNMVPLPSKSEAESACFYNNYKITISPAENVVLSRGRGPTSPIRPWGPTWTWMSCPASRLFIHACVTWNTEYLLDKSKLKWLEHCLQLQSVWVRLVLILCHTALWELCCCEMWESSYAPCAAAKTSPLLLFLFKQQQ